MKKLTLGISILMVSLIFYTCSKNEITLEEQAVSFEKMLEDYNANKSDSQKGKLMTGKIVIADMQDLKGIAVVTDEQAREHSAFYYQPTEGANLSDEIINNGTILFLKDRLLIKNNDTKDHYVIKLLDATLKDALSFKHTINTVGIGETSVQLENSSINNSRGIGIGILPDADGTCTCVYKYGNTTPECSSGGEGSTSCSCCGCSVSCSDSYYACCNES